MIEYRIYALMRSGQHAIINWMYSQINSPVFVANSITGNLWHKHADHAIDEFLTNRVMPNILDACIYSKNIDAAGELSCISNIEDEDFPLLSFRPDETHLRLGIGTSKVKNVMILRDPYNFLASRFKRRFPRMGKDMDVKKWKTHAREYSRRTILLDDPILVNFNRWFSSKDYRKTLTSKLGIPFTDAGLNDVPSYGGGSSFDSRNYDGNAQKMKVLKRYASLMSDNKFLTLINDKELLNLSNELFDMRVKLLI